jgi:very-short-patch-repair endonuclease
MQADLMQSPESTIRRIAETQYGVITRAQALGAGLSDSSIARRVETGVWTRLDRGAYLVFGRPTPLARLASATVALPAVVSHQSAAGLHRLTWTEPALPVVTVPHRFTNRFAGVSVHESTDLVDDDVVIVDGLPTTSVERTLFDLARGTKPWRLRAAIEAALLDKKVTVADLDAILGRVGRRGRPGTALFREVLSDLGPGYVATESELERRTVELLRNAGLPAPVRQFPIPWRVAVDGRVDLAYPDARLLIECDGRRWHTATEAFERDRRRDNLAQLNRWRVLRFTWEDVTRLPGLVVDQVREALASSVA